MKSILSIILFLIVIVFGASFAMLNDQPVFLDYYFGKIGDISLPIILFGAVIIGLIIGIFGSFGLVFSIKRKYKKLLKEKNTIESELNNLRTLPLKDE